MNLARSGVWINLFDCLASHVLVLLPVFCAHGVPLVVNLHLGVAVKGPVGPAGVVPRLGPHRRLDLN